MQAQELVRMAKQLSEKGYQLGLMARRIELLNTLNDELGGKHVVKQIDFKTLMMQKIK